MSIKAMTWAFDQPLSGNEKVVLLALADHANDEGECWPTISRIAQKAYVSEKTVKRIVLSLTDQGYLSMESRTTEQGRCLSNKYRLHMSNQAQGGCQFVTLGGGGQFDPLGGGGGHSYDPPEGDTVVPPYEPSEEPSHTEGTVVPSCTKAPKRNSYPADFEAFWTAYPTDSLMSKKLTADAWRRLSLQDRQRAIDSIPWFRQYCERSPDYRPVHAVRYLTQRRFDGFDGQVTINTGAPANAKRTHADVFAEFDAINRARRAGGS